MNSPTTALAWEIWHRHRRRLLAMAGILLAFMLFYSKVCALVGMNLTNQDLLDQVANKLSHFDSHLVSAEQVLLALCCIFVLCGPKVALCFSLFYVMWMFTTAESDPRTRRLITFAPRLFNCPVSTSFLYWWFVLAGQAAIVAVYCAWTYLFRQPQLDIFAAYQNCLLWMTLLVLAQSVTWALAGWPVIASIICTSLWLAPLLSPASPEVLRSVPVLSGLYVLGLVLARVGLGKMRHGQWQGLNWTRMIAAITPAREISGPIRFASPARSQLWFEWRRSGRLLCILAGVGSLSSIAVHLALRFSLGWGPLTADSTSGFACCLLGLPLFLHFCFGMSPRQNDMPFMLNRPLATGQFVMVKLKADALSTLGMWVPTLVAFGALSLLGDMSQVQKGLQAQTIGWPVLIFAMLFVTWRLSVANLCFTWSGKPRLAQMPAVTFLAAYAGTGALVILRNYPDHWNLFWRLLPGVLAGLVVVKLLLAFLTFRLSLKRGLLAPSAAAGYLATWIALAIALLTPALIALHGTDWTAPVCLGIVLLIPLARIGFCPISLSWNRHA